MENSVNARSLLASLLFLGLSAPLFAGAPAVTVEYAGNFSRSHYFRVEKIDEKQFVILSKFSEIEETRLPVFENKWIQQMPPIVRLSAKAGELTAKVDIRMLISDMGGASLTIELDDEAIRPIHLQPRPEITIEGRGYYNRSNYVRLETWKEKEGSRQFVVLYDFASPVEIRLPVVQNSGEAAGDSTKVILAEARGRKVRLEMGGGRLARVEVDGAGFRPLILLDN